MTNSSVKSKKQEIIYLLLNKEAKGLELLSEQYASFLLGFIKRYIKQEEAAAMILQNTFFKIKNKIKRFDPNTEIFLPWIARIALEEAIKSLKTKRHILQNKPAIVNVAC